MALVVVWTKLDEKSLGGVAFLHARRCNAGIVDDYN